MNKYASLKDKLGRMEKVCGTTVSFFDEPLLIERLNRDDLDFIVFDMEHGRYDTEGLLYHLQMCRIVDVPSIVRVQDTAYHLISKTVDIGADGIMLPRTETLEQLRTAVDAMYFYPIGKKGYGGLSQFRKDETFLEFQKGRILIPQIESPKGIDNLPVMLKEFGDRISGVIVGPYDLSVMAGTPGNIYSDIMLAYMRQIVGVCLKFNKSVGIFCGNIEDAAAYKEMGANIFWMNLDIDLFMAGFNQKFDALAGI
jgi:2-keto-3-deoxy-L-rhamnonate aldolase RhmA